MKSTEVAILNSHLIVTVLGLLGCGNEEYRGWEKENTRALPLTETDRLWPFDTPVMVVSFLGINAKKNGRSYSGHSYSHFYISTKLKKERAFLNWQHELSEILLVGKPQIAVVITSK
jgi:hypothetical protein